MDNQDKPVRLTRQDLRQRKPTRSHFETLERQRIALVLDGVEGTYNQGAIFRLCDAFLLEKVHFCGVELQLSHRRFLKAARGTHGWVPHGHGEDIELVIQTYRERGYQIVAVEQCLGSQEIDDIAFDSCVCLVFGGELTGVSQAIIDSADVVAELPSLGMANSLNVAMSAGIAVYAATRKKTD